MTGAYYLRVGFIDLHNTMGDDPHTVSHLSVYKKLHWRLAELTGALDRILQVYIGTSIIMAMVDMCFVIFTLRGDFMFLVLLGSIGVLSHAIFTLPVVSALSISINSWETVFVLYFWNN